MHRKTLEISTYGTRLSVASRQLVIERPEKPKVTLPIEDLGVVMIDDTRASYTQAVFLELMKANATVIITGADHLPAGMMLPLDGHHVQTERHRAQIAASEPTRKRIWQELIKAKIRQQASVLDYFNIEDGGLRAMARRVKSGDTDNLESQAAQRYWPLLFGKNFTRDRTEEGINSVLNYGYAVIRAATARAIVASGLIPSLGVFHKNRSNAFCLADDLFEPYRPLVDWQVKRLVLQQREHEMLDVKSSRASLLSLFNEGVRANSRNVPILGAIELSAASLARALTGGEMALALPESMPLGQSIYGEADVS